jgi:hypothetical protein
VELLACKPRLGCHLPSFLYPLGTYCLSLR